MNNLMRIGIVVGVGVLLYGATGGENGGLKQSIKNTLSHNWSSPITRQDLAISANTPKENLEENRVEEEGGRYTSSVESIAREIEEGEKGEYRLLKLYVMDAPRHSTERGEYLLLVSPDNTSQNSFSLKIQREDYHLKPGFILSKVRIEDSRLAFYTINPILNPDYPYQLPSGLR